jgi:type VI secretion system protein ImpA
VSLLNADLLMPIAGGNPAGANLRYDPIYDQVKEARREEEDLPLGDWQTGRKMADWPTVIKLTSTALTKKTKDLQLAAWLTEAWLNREGFSGLNRGLVLLRELIGQYWDTLYPELDDGDAEMRAAPLEWICLKFDLPVRRVPLNQSGHSLLDYRAARTVPTEAEADGDSQKAEARAAAVESGKLTPEAFDAAFTATPKSWYRALVEDIEACQDSINALDTVCAERFADVAPGFAPLRSVLQEARQTAGQLLARKLELEPDAPGEEPLVAEVSLGEIATDGDTAMAAGTPLSVGSGPRTSAEAAAWIIAAARRLRQDQPTEPTSYLLVRGFRWGELRGAGGQLDPKLLTAPPTEIRTRLKGMLLDESWRELLNTAEEVMAQPYGRGWLDLQRYVLSATDGLGGEYEAVGSAIRGALRTLLADLPELLTQTLMDDSATANAETLAWLRAEKLLPAEVSDVATEADVGRPGSRRDPWDLAVARARDGDARGAMELLMRQATQERSSRARFMRRTQAAEIMVNAGMAAIALPVLRELLEQVEAHRLEEWEAADDVSQPLGLLYRCGVQLDSGVVDTRALYERICRLDPVRAIQLETGRSGNEGS